MPTNDKHDVILEWAERVREASEEATPGPWELSEKGPPGVLMHHDFALHQGPGANVYVQVDGLREVVASWTLRPSNARLIAETASPDIAAAVREVVVLSMEHMATLDEEPMTEASEAGKPKEDSMVGSYVVVCTDKRGVFGGVLESRDGDKAVLADCRMCVYWPREVHGMPGLARTGPLDGSRVSPAGPRVELVGVTAVLECTDEARERWEAAPWS